MVSETAHRHGTSLSSTNNNSSIKHHTPKVNVEITHYIYIRAILTHSIQQGPQEKLTDLHLVKEFPAFCGTKRFITIYTLIPQMVPILNQRNPVHTFPSYLFRIYRCPAESRTYSQIQKTCSYNLYYAIQITC